MRHYELIQEQKNREYLISSMIIQQSTASAFGSLKKDDFIKFLDSFDSNKKKEPVNFEKIKDLGIEVEDN